MGMKYVVPALILLALIVYRAPVGTTAAPTSAPTDTPSAAHEVKIHSLDETVAYLREHGGLPDYYLTKAQASARGWKPSEGNLADVAPGMMIGGDHFTNSQHLLPSAKGRLWYEADFDYVRGTRNAKRILYSNDGLIYVTYDHYQTVQSL